MAGTKLSLRDMFYVFIAEVIGISLTPTLSTYVSSLTISPGSSGNLTGAAATMMPLVMVFWVIIGCAVNDASDQTHSHAYFSRLRLFAFLKEQKQNT